MIINDLDGCYIVFDTKNRNMELDTLFINTCVDQYFLIHLADNLRITSCGKSPHNLLQFFIFPE